MVGLTPKALRAPGPSYGKAVWCEENQGNGPAARGGTQIQTRPTRLGDVKGLGALETGKQAGHSHPCPLSVPHQQDTLRTLYP